MSITGLDQLEDAIYAAVRALGAEANCPICKCNGTQHEVYCEVRAVFDAMEDVYCDWTREF